LEEELIKQDEYQYYWETLDEKHSGGPYRTIGALKSALQTGSYNGRWDRLDHKWVSFAKSGVTIHKYKVSYEPESFEVWKKEDK
jgi:hypothetical protein